jgi:hypothetical protein
MVVAHEGLFRTYLSVSVGGGGHEPARRGARRLGWIREALAPLSDAMPAESLDRLVTGLALLTGIEAIIVLRDVCGLDDARVEATAVDLARTLVRGVLAKAGNAA